MKVTKTKRILVEGLKERFMKMGYTVKQIADSAGCSVTYVYETFKQNYSVSYEFVFKLAEILNVRADELFNEVEYECEVKEREEDRKILIPGIADLFKRMGYTDKKIAEKIGYSEHHVQSAKTNKACVSDEFVDSIAKLLKKDPNELCVRGVVYDGKTKRFVPLESKDEEKKRDESQATVSDNTSKEISGSIVDESKEHYREIKFEDIFNNTTTNRAESDHCVIDKSCPIRTEEIDIDSDKSYYAKDIRKWCRKSICKMTNVKDVESYDPIMAGMVSDFFFHYFINRRKPLYKDAKYFVKSKKGHLFLKRDKENSPLKRNYMIANTEKITEIEMTKKECERVEEVLRGLNIDYEIRDVTYLSAK